MISSKSCDFSADASTFLLPKPACLHPLSSGRVFTSHLRFSPKLQPFPSPTPTNNKQKREGKKIEISET